MGFSATILRPAYFIDNDLMIKDVIFNHGVYPMPIGSKGIAMVDVRDIAEVAAIELIRRHQAQGELASETINLVGPDTLTGMDVAAIWTEILGRRSFMVATILPGLSKTRRHLCRSGWLMKCV